MQIVCPSCGSAYSLTPEQLGGGRMLRCAKCRETWHATPEGAAGPDSLQIEIPSAEAEQGSLAGAPEAEPAQATAEARSVDAPLPEGGRARPARPPRSRRPRPRARAPRLKVTPARAAAALLIAALGAGLLFRAPVVRILPQMAKVYAAVGLPVNLRGLEFAGLRSELLIDKDQAVLLVEGEIKGVAPSADVPKVALSLRGPEGREIYAWTSEAARSTLAKGESTTFKARLASPPAEGREVVVRFAEAERAATAH